MRVYPIEDSRPAPDRPPTSKETDVQTITPFLWFDDQAEQAAEFYVSVFPNSEILRVSRNGGGGIGDPGAVMSVSLVIDGLRLEAFNGGPDHPFPEAISLFVPAATQDEIDRLWDRLLAGGGREDRCGWLEDRWGLSWQIVPTVLFELLADPDPARAGGVGVGQELEQHRRDDLPGQAPPVLEPAAPVLPAAARQQAVPEAVDLVLGVRPHEQRDGLGERVVGATVERLEPQPVDHEAHRHDGARVADPAAAAAVDPQDLGVGEHGHVELGGLLGLVVEPQERGDGLHVGLLAGRGLVVGWSGVLNGIDPHRLKNLPGQITPNPVQCWIGRLPSGS